MIEELSSEEVAALLAQLDTLPKSEKEALLDEIEQAENNRVLQACRDDFLQFCKRVYSGFKEGPHHRFMRPRLHDVMSGALLRLTVSMPPRFGKSESIAYLFVAWYLGHNPSHHVMMVTHTAALSAAFGRKVRNLIDSPVYQEIFPQTKVSRDKSASDDWATTTGGAYLAVGIGGNIAGRGAHLLVCDDLVSEQAVLANPDTAFETAWTYMQVGPLQRLMPGGRIVMIGCMTAETRVLMADGSEKELQHIKVGDAIATYDNGTIATSRVTNWIKHRDDTVYKIRTTSGKVVRANKRHPFLVDRNGERAWVRVRDLRVGDCLVEAVQPPDVVVHTKPRGCAQPATSENCAPMDVSACSVATGIGENGEASNALLKGVAHRPYVRGSATVATAKPTGVLVSVVLRLRKSATAISSTAMAFLHRTTMRCWPRKVGVAPSASSLQREKTRERAESQSSTSTTATTPSASAVCSVTTATLQSDMPSPNACCLPLPNTYVCALSAIVEIVEDGVEPVFDMEVERTENFIANGVVSHNTRWGKKDPIGRALSWATENPEALPWTEIRFPAILPSGKSLWPEQWPLEQLLAKKASMRKAFWAAQYMQDPTSEEGAILKREYWKVWQRESPPPINFVIQVWDTAHEVKTRNDYSACTTWGVWANDKTERNEVMLLNATRGRWEFPQLKAKADEQRREWDPECLLIEKKAAGAPLIQELRQSSIFVEEYSPSRGARGVSNDKIARTNAVSTIFEDGLVWTPDKRWAWEVVEECAEFPNGEHDDYVDTVVMAMMRYRRGGFVTLSGDRDEDDMPAQPKRRRYY